MVVYSARHEEHFTLADPNVLKVAVHNDFHQSVTLDLKMGLGILELDLDVKLKFIFLCLGCLFFVERGKKYLVEELLALIDMVVVSLVRAADNLPSPMRIEIKRKKKCSLQILFPLALKHAL